MWYPSLSSSQRTPRTQKVSQKTHNGQNHQEVGNARLPSGEPHFLYPKSSPPVKKIVHPLPPSPPKNHGNIVIEASGWGAGLDHFLSLLPSPIMLSPTQKGVFQFPCDQTQFDPDPDEIPMAPRSGHDRRGEVSQDLHFNVHTHRHRRPSC